MHSFQWKVALEKTTIFVDGASLVWIHKVNFTIWSYPQAWDE